MKIQILTPVQHDRETFKQGQIVQHLSVEEAQTLVIQRLAAPVGKDGKAIPLPPAPPRADQPANVQESPRSPSKAEREATYRLGPVQEAPRALASNVVSAVSRLASAFAR